MSSNKDSTFGRDEMLATFLGGGLHERLVRPKQESVGSKRSHRPKTIDVADMTAHEAAEWLQHSTNKSKDSAGVQRHRSTKVRQYHALLFEEQQQRGQPQHEPIHPRQDNDDSVDGASIDDPEIRSAARPTVTRRRRRPSTSSSSVSDTPVPRRRLRRQDSSSSSSGEEEVRRSRLVKRRMQQSEVEFSIEEKNTIPAVKPAVSTPQKTQSTSGSSSESSGGSSGEDSSFEATSSEEEEVRAKPLFVPRHKRGTVKSVNELESEAESAEARRRKKEEQRKKESRSMVQMVLLNTGQQAQSGDYAFEGISGARNEVPDDADYGEEDVEVLDEWEVRELERLVYELDIENARREEELERIRRRGMTDEEILAEESQARTDDREEKRGSQRYFHKGAFYMDKMEWDESDVRHKASTYAAAPTGQDKIDKQMLPGVMQVKKFGRANQNLKYKGLAAEDTTDKHAKMLPVVGRKHK